MNFAGIFTIPKSTHPSCHEIDKDSVKKDTEKNDQTHIWTALFLLPNDDFALFSCIHRSEESREMWRLLGGIHILLLVCSEFSDKKSFYFRLLLLSALEWLNAENNRLISHPSLVSLIGVGRSENILSAFFFKLEGNICPHKEFRNHVSSSTNFLSLALP